MRKSTKTLFLIIPTFLILGVIVLAGRVYPIEIGSLGGGSGGTSYDTVSRAEAEGGTSTTGFIYSPERFVQGIVARLLSSVGITINNPTFTGTTTLSGTTYTLSDTITYNLPANKNFLVNVSGTGELQVTNGVGTSSLMSSPQIIVSGTSSVFGTTTETTLATYRITKRIGPLGEIRIWAVASMGTTTPVINKTLKIYVSDGVATVTVFNSGAISSATIAPYIILGNNGSTTSQVQVGNSGTYNPYAALSGISTSYTLNTANDIDVSITGTIATSTTMPFYLLRGTVESVYAQ